MGFSQGACLTLEFAARRPRRYAAVVAFTGGLIGPPDTPRDYVGDFSGTPIVIGSSDVDPHVLSNVFVNRVRSFGMVPASTSVFTRGWATPSTQTNSLRPMHCWEREGKTTFGGKHRSRQ
jgi:pimeloyl-ACP methyl ester carboxylesterase